MKQNRPNEMTLIGGLYLFEAVLVVLALVVIGEEGLYTDLRKILSSIPANIIIPMLTMLKLIMVFSYLALKKWGYWLVMLYSAGLILMNVYLKFQLDVNLNIWEIIFSLYVLKYTFENRNLFYNV